MTPTENKIHRRCFDSGNNRMRYLLPSAASLEARRVSNILVARF